MEEMEQLRITLLTLEAEVVLEVMLVLVRMER
jgi:hypothetical protein